MVNLVTGISQIFSVPKRETPPSPTHLVGISLSFVSASRTNPRPPNPPTLPHKNRLPYIMVLIVEMLKESLLSLLLIHKKLVFKVPSCESRFLAHPHVLAKRTPTKRRFRKRPQNEAP